MASQRQTQLIRKKLFSSIMRQDIGWFDTYKIKELTSRLTNDVDKIKEGFGDKFA
jgi:ABC-type multidrug transport system fused ATPase/permease subunit